MRILVSLITTISFLFLAAGCCTIISGRMQDLPVTSQPSGATITVGGQKMQTPATIHLDRRMAVYEIKVEMEGYEPTTVVLKKGLNGWIFGNIVFGGIIGLVIDIASGSASKFVPSEVEVNLMKKQLNTSSLEGKDVLFIKLSKR